jgi:hypothetical protein
VACVLRSFLDCHHQRMQHLMVILFVSPFTGSTHCLCIVKSSSQVKRNLVPNYRQLFMLVFSHEAMKCPPSGFVPLTSGGAKPASPACPSVFKKLYDDPANREPRLPAGSCRHVPPCASPGSGRRACTVRLSGRRVLLPQDLERRANTWPPARRQ